MIIWNFKRWAIVSICSLKWGNIRRERKIISAFYCAHRIAWLRIRTKIITIIITRRTKYWIVKETIELSFHHSRCESFNWEIRLKRFSRCPSFSSVHYTYWTKRKMQVQFISKDSHHDNKINKQTSKQTNAITIKALKRKYSKPKKFASSNSIQLDFKLLFSHSYRKKSKRKCAFVFWFLILLYDARTHMLGQKWTKFFCFKLEKRPRPKKKEHNEIKTNKPHKTIPFSSVQIEL